MRDIIYMVAIAILGAVILSGLFYAMMGELFI